MKLKWLSMHCGNGSLPLLPTTVLSELVATSRTCDHFPTIRAHFTVVVLRAKMVLSSPELPICYLYELEFSRRCESQDHSFRGHADLVRHNMAQIVIHEHNHTHIPSLLGFFEIVELSYSVGWYELESAEIWIYIVSLVLCLNRALVAILGGARDFLSHVQFNFFPFGFDASTVIAAYFRAKWVAGSFFTRQLLELVGLKTDFHVKRSWICKTRNISSHTSW